MSHVTCHVSHVMCQMWHFFLFFSDNLVKLIGGGSVINVAYPVFFMYTDTDSIYQPSYGRGGWFLVLWLAISFPIIENNICGQLIKTLHRIFEVFYKTLYIVVRILPNTEVKSNTEYCTETQSRKIGVPSSGVARIAQEWVQLHLPFM